MKNSNEGSLLFTFCYNKELLLKSFKGSHSIVNPINKHILIKKIHKKLSKMN